METDTDVTRVTTKDTTTYMNIVMSRWEVRCPRQRIGRQSRHRSGSNVMAMIGECIRGGGGATVRHTSD